MQRFEREARPSTNIEDVRPPTDHQATGGHIQRALDAARSLAQAGGTQLPLTKSPGTQVQAPFQGPIHSHVPGRTDRIRLDVKPGSYVFPADFVSIIGQGNTAAGNNIVKAMFAPLNLSGGIQIPPGHRGKLGATKAPTPSPQHGPSYKGPQLYKYKKQGKAEGGELPEQESPPTQPEQEDENVPIIAAGGEIVVPPELIAHKFGDLDRGHRLLDKFILQTRDKEIHRLKHAPAPKK
jgi:hypothetical protein